MLAKFKKSIHDQIAQGMTPESIARAIVIASAIAVFPLLGVTTALGVAAAHRFRLSHIIVQSVNYLLYPVQILLIPVFARLGEWVLRWQPISFNPLEVIHQWKILSFSEFLEQYGRVGIAAVLGWLLVAPMLAFLIQKRVQKWVSKLRS